MVFYGVQWPYTLVSVTPIGNTSWLCHPRWESYALELAKSLVSHARDAKVVHNFTWNPLYYKVLYIFALNPLYGCIEYEPPLHVKLKMYQVQSIT